MSALDASNLLRPPGEGLLTISTGSGAARTAMSPYFSEAVWTVWSERARKILSGELRQSCLLGVPSDSGGGICRGAAHGPLAIRAELFKKFPQWAKCDLGDVPCIPQLVHDSMLNDAQKLACGRALWGADYAPDHAVSPLSLVEEFLTLAFRKNDNFRPLVLGGDHSISGAVFAAMSNAARLDNVAVLHFDAHTDLLDLRFGVEHCFGTWTAHALKLIRDPARWVQVGIRASGQPKKHWEAKFGLRQYWARELQKKDPVTFAQKLVREWRAMGCERLYITNDIDATDAAAVPATGTPETGGLASAWIATVIKETSRALPLVGADLMEVAPVLGSHSDARKTVRTACRYLESLHWH